MNLQYISDNTGKPTGVYIPIKEWNKLNAKHKGLEQDDADNFQLAKRISRKTNSKH